MKELLTLTSFLRSTYGIVISDDYQAEIADDWDIYCGNADWIETYFDNGQEQLKRDRFSLSMGKKVCEDWASVLLNEKTGIQVDNEKEQEFLFGSEELNGGILGKDFWDLQNQLVERTFATGTGATLIRYTKIDENGYPSKDTEINLHYVDARNIYPISQFNGDIKECAFISTNGKIIVVEAHTLREDGSYLIRNHFFKCQEGGGILPIIMEDYPSEFVSDIKLFHCMKPNIYNPITDSGLGLSIISYAKDAIKSVDLAYDNYCSDIELGKKMIFMKRDLLGGKGGNQAPQGANQQLFVYVGESMPNENPMVYEFNPSLRVSENSQAVQSMLDYLSFRVGLGTKHYQFNQGSIVTATQYVGDKQELVQNANKHYIIIEKYLVGLIKSIASAYSKIGQGQPVENVVITFSDGFIIDEQQELDYMRGDVIAKILDPIVYIMKKYGVDEKKAREMQYKEQEVEEEF